MELRCILKTRGIPKLQWCLDSNLMLIKEAVNRIYLNWNFFANLSYGIVKLDQIVSTFVNTMKINESWS